MRSRTGVPPIDIADMVTLSRLVRAMLNAVHVRMGCGIVEMDQGRRIEKYLTAMDAEVNLYLVETTGTATRRGRRDVARAWSNTTKMADDDFDEQRDLLLFAAKSTGMTLDDVERMTRALEWVMERHTEQDARERRTFRRVTVPVMIGIQVFVLAINAPPSWWAGYPWAVGLVAAVLSLTGRFTAAVLFCASAVAVTVVASALLRGDTVAAVLTTAYVVALSAVTTIIVRRMRCRARS